MWCCVWVVERAKGIHSDAARSSNIDVVYVDLILYRTTVHVRLSQEYLNLYTNVKMHFQDVKFRCSIITPHFSNQHLICRCWQLRVLSHIWNAHSVAHRFPQNFDGNNTLSNSMMSLVDKPMSMSNDIALQMRIDTLYTSSGSPQSLDGCLLGHQIR